MFRPKFAAGSSDYVSNQVSESSDSDVIENAPESTEESGNEMDERSDIDSGTADEDVNICTCRNCTGTMVGSTCEDCGHSACYDDALFKASNEVFTSTRPSTSEIALLYDERMELHLEEEALSVHPERPDRVRAVVARVLGSGVGARCWRIPCREATALELQTVHTPSLISMVEDMSRLKAIHRDVSLSGVSPDTYVNEHTNLCARLAAGSAAEVAKRVALGESAHGAAIVRPPGHHAESGTAMGFCFFNNAAVAARAAQACGAQRVIILDWDVHHGNGTQHIFEQDPSVLYISLHRYDSGDFYPGTGSAGEVGVGAGEGFNVNIAWNGAGMQNGDYLAAFNHVIMPIAYEYNPNLIIVSAGFDAAEGDPIGECRLTPECFAHMTSMLKSVAPLVLLLEGGYNLTSTALSTEACLRVLLGEQPGCLPGVRYASAKGNRSIQESIRVQSRYWRSLTSISEQKLDPHPLGPLIQTMPEAHGPEVKAALMGGPGYPKSRIKKSRRSVLLANTNKRFSGSKFQILFACHKRAMRVFWRRRMQGDL
ncbi:hypothetical protein CEUSTIGMA_g9634.t1 [Chlamydomonas eustigma]|uniref:Histone deacetylase domain-containing protein n=1 Tax=Chlamydomonas eustigma TaxID=1157962 RepID=A0A250XGQ6_9CHLO|nr:hypothetical protein CEUSTIGMA_g9634.t1 [Chlamydomonas eustigma]|eukprot:GAX82206.1 hypothetical protein CEUSTIGMA_g9634.t1 [Chlamydomonas eustigma]